MASSLLLTVSPVLLIVCKATAVLLVALALTALMQRASASSRHLVWAASLCALLAVPALAVWSPVRFAVLPGAWTSPDTAQIATAVSVPDARMRTNARGERANGTAAPNIDTDADPSAAVRQTAGAPTWLADTSPLTLLLLAWGTMTAAIIGWLLYGVWNVRRIVQGADVLSTPEWQGALIDIADRLELELTPRLLRSDTVTMPFACGLRTPTIVLPKDCDAWSVDRRSAVLLHELAHIRRRDIVGHTLGRIACALYWFHPLAWTAARRLRAESERACDDLALSCGTRPSDYAEHLLDIVTAVRTHATPSVAMAMATRSEFEGRMLAILDPSLLRAAPTRVQASTLAGGVMMFAIIAGSAVPQPVQPSRPTVPTTAISLLTDSSESQTLGVSGDTSSASSPTPTPAPVAVPDPLPSVDGKASQAQTNVADASQDAERDVSRTDAPEADVGTADSSARAIALARILRTDSDAKLRRTAAWGLNDFTNSPVAVDALLFALLRDPSADVREMAAWSLNDAADQRRVAVALAESISQEGDKVVRRMSVWSLGVGANDRHPEAIDALTRLLTDEEAATREMAAWGLGNASPRRAPTALIALLADRDARVRSTAAWALFQIEDTEAADALDVALQKETDANARWAMVRALSAMGDRAVAPLQRIIDSSDSPLRALAIRALAGAASDPWPQPRPRPRPYP